MKHRYLFVSILLAVSLFSACTREIPVQQTVVRHGLLYEKGKAEPFTGVITGEAREGYRSTICTYRKAYRNGIMNGDCCFWHPNGHLESIEPYRDGKINGVLTRYDENGRVLVRAHLVDGQRGGEHGEIFWHRAPTGG
ncbi:MAG: hypothetical protein JEZ11_06275 [Desulfobacterales bacterium]|nr:hypothetical protein [Desulfobacterales bacterium]